MTPRLDNELSEALRRQSGPLEVQDSHGQSRYVILTKDEYRQLIEREFHQWLQVGLDQEARGEAVEWNLDEILAEAHRRYDARRVS
jgi:hypothetical protein